MKRSADPNSDKMQLEFRQKLENYEAAPTDNLWDKIELSLDKEEALVYKNRFRIYSRLAAACLLLLLAFGVFFIPNKLKQLKGGSAELAATQNAETKRNSSPQAQKKPENIAAETAIAQTEITSENAMVPGGKTASANSEMESLESVEQLAENSETARAVKTENAFTARNAPAEKTVAFNVQKVNPKAPQSENSTSENLQNAMIPAAKTARDVSGLSETTLARNTEIVSPEATIAAISEPERSAEITAPETTNERQKTAAESKIAALKTEGTAKNASVAVSFKNDFASDQAPAVSKASTFSSQNPTVSEAKESHKNLSFLSNKTARLQSAANNKLILPDSNMLAAIPVAEDLTEAKAKGKKAPRKTGKWLLALGYSGSSFQAGMRLANQAVAEPGGSLISYQQQTKNISLYNAAIQEFNQETRSGYSQGGALQVAYKFTKNWLLQSGFKYSRNQAQTASHYAFSNLQFGNTGINSQVPKSQNLPHTALETVLENSFDPDKTQILNTPENKTSYIFQQIGVPVNLRYQTNAKTLYYFGAAGFSINFLTSATIKTKQQQTVYTTSRTKDEAQSLNNAPQEQAFRNWMPAVSLQTGVGYQLSQHWQLETALEGEQYLKPLIHAERTAGAKQRNPRSVGASLKLGYSF